MNQQTILYFGTFDPPHNGHLGVAEFVLSLPEIEALWFVVSPRSPFKLNKACTPFEHRAAMCRIMSAMLKATECCTIEKELPRPNYTALTLAELHKSFPEKKFAILMGGDNWPSFSRWRHSKKIAAGHRIYLYPRPGYPDPDPGMHGTQIQRSVVSLNAPLLPFSATEFRKSSGKYMSDDYVPGPVRDYIKDEGLYP